MAAIYKGTLGLIGNTPLVEPVNLEKELGLEATILVKLEYLNPAGSVKDRVAKAMIEDAEEKGLLKEGSVIIEPTSGNTGIGLASIAAAKGYSIIFHQRIDNVRGNDQIVGAARDKIVHRGDFTRIHLAERSAASGALAAACKAAHNQCQTQKDRE